MILNIPIIGKIRVGKDKPSAGVIKSLPITKSLDVLGGLLDFGKGKLSNEKTISKKLLLANTEWVYRNNDVIAQAVSAVEFELYQVGLKNGEIVYNEIKEHPVLDLLDKFNSTTTKSDAIYTTQSHKKLTGDAFWLLNRGKNNEVTEIFILPPDKVELVLGNPTDGSAELVEAYLYKDVIDGKKVDKTYRREDIIHFKKPNPSNPFRGYGTVEAIADTIDTDLLTNSTQRNFFEKGAITNFVLTTEAKITQDQLKRLKAEMRSAYAGSKNAYSTMILGGGLKPSEIGFSNRDMQYIDLMEWYRDKIMIAFGNTKASIGIIDDVNRASHEDSMLSWMRNTIKPEMDAIVNTINEYLVPLYGDRLILGYCDPVEDDISSDIEQAVALKNSGIITVNEAREMIELDPVKDGDALAIQQEPTPQDNQDNRDNQKRIKKQSNVPDALQRIDLKALLRKRKLFSELAYNQELKESAKPMIREVLSKTEVKAETNDSYSPNHPSISDEVIMAYYHKQKGIVEVMEGRFKQEVQKYIGKIEKAVMNNISTEIANKGIVQKDFLTDDEVDSLLVDAQLDLRPILLQELIMAGQEAYRLIGIEDTYLPYRVLEDVTNNVEAFASSMINTDKELITNIIAEGIDKGQSMPEITKQITDKFDELRDYQAERIARTEVARTQIRASEDAWEQSGVVEGKMWITAGATDECAKYEGKIVGLGKNFYSSDSEFQDGDPPLHPNCKCDIVPIVEGTKAFKPLQIVERELMEQKIAELEAQLDKRTKSAKELMSQRTDDAVYIKILESHLGVSDEK